MTFDSLRKDLAWLGIDERNWRALALLPLVHVAWADGAIQATERAIILDTARSTYPIGPEAEQLLTTWLTHRPSDMYLQRGRRALFALAHMPQLPGTGTPEDVLTLCTRVAAAAGGFFGFGAVGRTEREALDAIAQSLVIRDATSWDAVFADDDDDTQVSSRDEWIATLSKATPIPSAVVEGRAWLRGRLLDTPIDLEVVEEISIGRARTSQIQIAHDALVSRNHAVLRRTPQGWFVEDLGSANGTRVNGERIVGRRLLGGETIQVGEERFDFVVTS